MSVSPSERTRTWRARMRAEGRCTVCATVIGPPPPPWACETCAAEAADRCTMRQREVDRPLERPTFELFELLETRRGRR